MHLNFAISLGTGHPTYRKKGEMRDKYDPSKSQNAGQIPYKQPEHRLTLRSLQNYDRNKIYVDLHFIHKEGDSKC